jgi:hypothetical protein
MTYVVKPLPTERTTAAATTTAQFGGSDDASAKLSGTNAHAAPTNTPAKAALIFSLRRRRNTIVRVSQMAAVPKIRAAIPMTGSNGMS